MAIYLFQMLTFFVKMGFYINFKGCISETYKIGLICSLLFRCFSLCSHFIKFHHEVDKLGSILYKNSYLCNLVDKYIKGERKKLKKIFLIYFLCTNIWSENFLFYHKTAKNVSFIYSIITLF